MARPLKTGMDYFPHDTDACNDEKVELLRMLYGNDGYAFYFIMLERIYRTKYGELLISEAETTQKLDEEIVIILSKKIQISEELFKKILKTCLKHKIFSEKKFNTKGVLTSDGIKKRMKPILTKRSNMAKKHGSRKIVSAAETPQKLGDNSAETVAETDIEKERKEEIKKRKEEEKKRLKKIPPELEDVKNYCLERKNGIDPETFIDYYQTNGWMRGKNKIKCWKSCIRTWEKNNNNGGPNGKTNNNEDLGNAYKEFEI